MAVALWSTDVHISRPHPSPQEGGEEFVAQAESHKVAGALRQQLAAAHFTTIRQLRQRENSIS